MCIKYLQWVSIRTFHHCQWNVIIRHSGSMFNVHYAMTTLFSIVNWSNLSSFMWKLIDLESFEYSESQINYEIILKELCLIHNLLKLFKWHSFEYFRILPNTFLRTLNRTCFVLCFASFELTSLYVFALQNGRHCHYPCQQYQRCHILDKRAHYYLQYTDSGRDKGKENA